MHSDMRFLLDLVIIILTAGIGTFLCNRYGQPRILGQILAGILIGPSVFGFVNHSNLINNLAEIGVILLMFLAGLETDYSELKKSFERSSLIAIGGIIAPFALGLLGVYLFKENVEISEAIFVGVILTATSLGITVQSLKEIGQLKTKQGVSILGAAIIDDIVGIIILTIVLGTFGQDHTSVTMLILKILLFFFVLSLVGEMLAKFILKNSKIIRKIKPIYLLSISLILALLFASFASEFGLAAIIGAYFIGVIISTTQLKSRIVKEISRFGYGFFIPIFFVNIGLGVYLDQVVEYLGIAIIITLIGIFSKIIGSGAGAKLSGFSNRQSLQIGISMVPRAEVSLIIANLGLKTGFIESDIFTSIILLVIVSTILTPLLLKKVYT